MNEKEFMTHIITEICDYAVDNDMEPNDTLSTIADNIKALLEISTFNRWKRSVKEMNREKVITHLQIIHTWAEFAREHDLQFFTPRHLKDIAQWSYDAIAMLKEQDTGGKIDAGKHKQVSR
jgi:hypothetical protein